MFPRRNQCNHSVDLRRVSLSTDFTQSFIMFQVVRVSVCMCVHVCACVLLILDRVTGLGQGHWCHSSPSSCPIRLAAGCKVPPTHLPAPCWTHHLSSYYTFILFGVFFFFLFSKHVHTVHSSSQNQPTLPLSLKLKPMHASHTFNFV